MTEIDVMAAGCGGSARPPDAGRRKPWRQKTPRFAGVLLRRAIADEASHYQRLTARKGHRFAYPVSGTSALQVVDNTVVVGGTHAT
jgi:hypothetical protein